MKGFCPQGCWDNPIFPQGLCNLPSLCFPQPFCSSLLSLWSSPCFESSSSISYPWFPPSGSSTGRLTVAFICKQSMNFSQWRMRAALRFHFVFSAWLIVGRDCCACLGTVLPEAPFSALIEFLCAGDHWDAGGAEPDGITEEGLSSPAPAGLYSSAYISNYYYRYYYIY